MLIASFVKLLITTLFRSAVQHIFPKHKRFNLFFLLFGWHSKERDETLLMAEGIKDCDKFFFI